MKVVDINDFASASPLLRGKFGIQLARRIMHLLSIDQVNRVHEQYGDHKGAGFTSRLLDDIGVHYHIGNAERLSKLPEGAFITVSNHPYGGLDGIMTIDLFAQLRPDYKFMVNQLLARITALKENFIAVTPTGNKKKGITAASIRGVRESMAHLQHGHPLGFFPSGAVSDFNLATCRVRDRTCSKNTNSRQSPGWSGGYPDGSIPISSPGSDFPEMSSSLLHLFLPRSIATHFC